MNKTYYQILAAFLLGTFACTGVSIAAEKGPAEIVLKSTIDPANREKPAFFPHAKHQENVECGVCHHTQGPDGQQMPYSKGMQIYKCESCHNKGIDGIPQNLNTFKKVAHELCKGCHRELQKQGKAAGPTKCNGCHRKDLK